MSTVGVKDLKEHLSQHLRAVEAGAVITVTDRGRPVAYLSPMDRDSPWIHLVEQGELTPARDGQGERERRPRPRPVRGAGTVSDLVGWSRG